MTNCASKAGTIARLNDEALQSLVPSRPEKFASPQLAPGMYEPSTEEKARFLRLVAACARVTTHYELFLLVQGQLQFFLPQDILVAAWGDFRAQDPQIDVISNIPGVRTNRICDIFVPLAKRLHKSWIDGGAQPILLDETFHELQACTNAACAIPCELPGMRLTLVHGIRNKRDGCDTLYIALCRHHCAIRATDARSRSLAELVIHQIDVAHRKLAALQGAGAPSNDRPDPLLLSAREEEIAYWLYEGKTNAQIAQILGISANTVKNHVHRTFEKLGANNRTEAALKYAELAKAITLGAGEGR